MTNLRTPRVHKPLSSENVAIADREIETLIGARQKCTWGANTNVYEITMMLVADDSSAITTELLAEQLKAQTANVTFDAPSDAQAVLNLAEGSHLTDSTQNQTLKYGVPVTRQFNFGLKRLDAIRIDGAIAMKLKVTAGDWL